jgi:hypothetical protein
MSSTQNNLLVVVGVTVVVFPTALFLYLWTAPIVVRPEPAFSCTRNLRQIDGAKLQWALEHRPITNGAVLNWDDIRPYLPPSLSNSLPKCPQGGTYAVGRDGELPSCSISEHTAAYRASTQWSHGH